ncbi:hypothetical protein NQ176_g5138 [Zarea fungicola]|uniref:Uncharacterized protein n=1 Tax=Zarea fungicola TaxID=93591 RepID=A0ACC1NB85_9HYPO|nr:hypothetical protein NQ176_g5138 [Lecanicillium fungicola]
MYKIDETRRDVCVTRFGCRKTARQTDGKFIPFDQPIVINVLQASHYNSSPRFFKSALFSLASSIATASRGNQQFKVPRALAGSLPYKSQIVEMRPQRKKTYMQKRAVVAGGTEERKARALMQQLLTVRNDAAAKRRAKKEETRAVFKKKMAENVAKKEAREKRESKDFWRKNGRKRAAGDDAGAGGKRSRN